MHARNTTVQRERRRRRVTRGKRQRGRRPGVRRPPLTADERFQIYSRNGPGPAPGLRRLGFGYRVGNSEPTLGAANALCRELLSGTGLERYGGLLVVNTKTDTVVALHGLERMMGVDSNCLSFIIDALEGIEKPTDSLAEQRIALARIFFYTGQTFFTMPTVKSEVENIRDSIRKAKHESWMMTHFGTLPIHIPEDAISQRAQRFKRFHSKERDCMLLAEAEAAQLEILLSFDFDFVDHLAGKSNVILMKPLDCWNALSIPRGSPPNPIQPIPSLTRVGGDGIISVPKFEAQVARAVT